MTLSQTTQKLQKYIQDNQNPNTISESEISKKYQELIDCITDHNHLYYIDSAPIISDLEYDQLFDYIKKIEQSFPYMISGNSPTQKLVNQIQDGFEKAEHTTPMLSLENSYKAEDIKEREQRTLRILEKKDNSQELIKNIIYNIEPKFDGLSIELIYQNGIFKKAITRGDGLIGEDVTANVKTIKNIPNKLNQDIKGIISFRGEILIGKSELKKINKQRELEGLQIYANTRNLASGSLKQLDTNITASRNLQCFVYEILQSSVISTKGIEGTHGEISLNTMGLPTYKKITSSSKIEDIIKTCENLETKKQLDQDDIEFDGLVIKIEQENIRKIIGSTNHHPRRAIAYKFPAEQVSTQIESIEFQVGRTGIITPVANLSPVNLSGATISRVSLHNFDFIKDKDIHHNDFVRLQRSGEVIPYITGVITDRRENNSSPVIAPKTCPSCNTNLTQVDMHYYCQNLECPAQIKEKIIRFVSKNCMDIEGIGESIIETLVEHKIISNISDLYKLLKFEIERVVRRFPGFADKKVVEIQKQLQESKNKEFRRLLNGLGISGVGKKTAKDISVELSKQKNCNNLKGISQYLTNQEFLVSIHGIGDKIIQAIINYRNTNLELLQKLEEIGLSFNLIGETNSDQSQSESKGNFCITGSFDFPRPKIIEEMEKNGYIFDSSPNKNTNYMLIGSKPGSKLSKAEELGVKIITKRDNILKLFPFLSEIKTDKPKPKGPEQMGLF